MTRAKAKADQAQLDVNAEEAAVQEPELIIEEAAAPVVKEAETVVKTDDEIRKEEEVTSIIYCGPSLRNNALQQNAVFTNGIPVHVKEHLEKCPAIKVLMVPVSQLSSCVANIGIQGTAEQVMYQTIQAYVRGEQ